MKSHTVLSTVLVAAVALWTGSAVAQSLRCNGDLASVGDSMITIFQKCGQPVFKAEPYCKRVQLQVPQAYGQPQYPGGPGTVIVTPPCITIEEWTYNPGAGQFWTTFRFENGQAVAIVYGERIR
jgi:hypothetical protein